jgi:hypothetical protein
VARRSPLGFAVRAEDPSTSAAGTVATAGGARRTNIVSFDDPRHDPIAFAWAKMRLEVGGWPKGYAQLVRDAGAPRRIGRQPGSALAAVERGEAGRTLSIAAGLESRGGRVTFVPTADTGDFVEGVAIPAGAAHPAAAQAFLAFLLSGAGGEMPPVLEPEDADAELLLADLLGATLVDAQDELWQAWAMLDRTGHPERPEMWMTQAPPWPPASIAKLVERDRSGSLLQTLASQIAPDVAVQSWLVRSWLAPPRLIDGALLSELARAADGKLIREPRFRAWLRAEWTAWARQRYRRVARTAGGWVP